MLFDHLALAELPIRAQRQPRRITAPDAEAGTMNAYELHDLAERAWNESNGDVMTAVKLLRDWSGLSLANAISVIDETKPATARRGQELVYVDGCGRVIRRIRT
jgi:hypothetical protein